MMTVRRNHPPGGTKSDTVYNFFVDTTTLDRLVCREGIYLHFFSKRNT
jgi:hypothetical protein